MDLVAWVGHPATKVNDTSNQGFRPLKEIDVNRVVSVFLGTVAVNVDRHSRTGSTVSANKLVNKMHWAEDKPMTNEPIYEQ